MKRLKDLKTGTRLNLVFDITFLFIISVMGIYTIKSKHSQLTHNTDSRMFEQVNDLATIIENQVTNNLHLVKIALKVCENEVAKQGRFVTTSHYIPVTAKNQETKAVSVTQLKEVLLGGKPLYNNHAIVDKTAALTGVVSSILQRIPQGYIRISTNIKQSDSTRAIDTYIPNTSPVVSALDQGKTYYGRAVILGEWYLTAYKPFRQDDGTVVVLFTGLKEKELSILKAIFSAKKYFKTGYPYLIDKTGYFLIHPTKEGTRDTTSLFYKQLVADADGYGKSTYTWEGKLKDQYFKYIPSINSFVAATLFEDEYLKARNDADKGTQMALILCIIMGIGLFITINILISRSITTALNQGVEFARKIAQGDLTASLNIDRKDEIGDLASALSQMLLKLKNVVISIRDSAENIIAASLQVSTNSQQISQGAVETATSTEEISSSMEQMAGNIQQNAHNAEQTDLISEKATLNMMDMFAICKESFDSINTIATKISIINEIAFQTNLLALNAAVEAARAGEYGRGFAVVASEVRKLAERSKLAAHEIENLSRSSVSITEKTRESLEHLVAEIQKTSRLVKEISVASMEQNSGSVQISTALQQLNGVTQQNASASEEMASSAEELFSQAENLKSAVSYFVIEKNARAAFIPQKNGKKEQLTGQNMDFGRNAKKIAESRLTVSEWKESE